MFCTAKVEHGNCPSHFRMGKIMQNECERIFFCFLIAVMHVSTVICREQTKRIRVLRLSQSCMVHVNPVAREFSAIADTQQTTEETKIVTRTWLHFVHNSGDQRRERWRSMVSTRIDDNLSSNEMTFFVNAPFAVHAMPHGTWALSITYLYPPPFPSVKVYSHAADLRQYVRTRPAAKQHVPRAPPFSTRIIISITIMWCESCVIISAVAAAMIIICIEKPIVKFKYVCPDEMIYAPGLGTPSAIHIATRAFLKIVISSASTLSMRTPNPGIWASGTLRIWRGSSAVDVRNQKQRGESKETNQLKCYII